MKNSHSTEGNAVIECCTSFTPDFLIFFTLPYLGGGGGGGREGEGRGRGREGGRGRGRGGDEGH